MCLFVALFVARFVFSAPLTQNAFMLPKSTTHLILVLALALACFQCQTGAKGPAPVATNGPVPMYGYQVVNIWPHDSNAFTQGLIESATAGAVPPKIETVIA